MLHQSIIQLYVIHYKIVLHAQIVLKTPEMFSRCLL